MVALVRSSTEADAFKLRCRGADALRVSGLPPCRCSASSEQGGLPSGEERNDWGEVCNITDHTRSAATIAPETGTKAYDIGAPTRAISLIQANPRKIGNKFPPRCCRKRPGQVPRVGGGSAGIWGVRPAPWSCVNSFWRAPGALDGSAKVAIKVDNAHPAACFNLFHNLCAHTLDLAGNSLPTMPGHPPTSPRPPGNFLGNLGVPSRECFPTLPMFCRVPGNMGRTRRKQRRDLGPRPRALCAWRRPSRRSFRPRGVWGALRAPSMCQSGSPPHVACVLESPAIGRTSGNHVPESKMSPPQAVAEALDVAQGCFGGGA